MKSAIISSTLAAVLGATVVSAHGYVSKAILDGKEYGGYDPYMVNPTPQRIFRKIAGNGPVEDLASVDLQCGGWQNSGSAPAPLTAPVTPGQKQTLQWTQWPDSHRGPIITYMARCPGDCASYEPGTSAVWFKIAEDGKHADGSWASTPYTFTIPQNLAPGNYIVRHELWALHSAWDYPGAQAYPSCFQVAVGGNGNGRPTNLVSFPGEYNRNTPGVIYDIYQGTGPYTIPGPPVWTG
ncbi:hypothetical protein AJ80_09429 [Polytolypa hystricis UAMH7299]|uniref:lytic cellulose monooxygenase (C4-dehydrogenating) n=1 Tax=Polytolypa hystricis (strain UAMH7299) TaxID=1447883 RepID=A0A2B7WQQ3_POLH7|nr:hypothetical protein AJ80_09429 [Polytolypa hystricis UAMH7299]